MIVNLRSASGGGKSTLTRQFIDTYPHTKVEVAGRFTKVKPRVVKYILPGDLAVLGNYEHYQMGGLDGFRPYDEMWKFIYEATQEHEHVLFESLLIGSNLGRTLELMDYVGNENFLVGFLDTPVDLCIERIYGRQVKFKQIKEEIVVATHKRCSQLYERFTGMGRQAVWIDHTNAWNQVHDIFTKAAWNPFPQLTNVV